MQKIVYDQIVALFKNHENRTIADGISDFVKDGKIQIMEGEQELHSYTPEEFIEAVLRDANSKFASTEDLTKRCVDNAKIKKKKSNADSK